MRTDLKRVALVAAHFPPSNLAAVHRARLWAQHLHEFGWKPIIITTHWRYYEENLDWALCDLLASELQVIRTRALPTKPIRLIGDIGFRALVWHFAALRQLLKNQEIDFLHITVPSFYSALLGELIYRRRPFPFGIDYIDPWVQPMPDGTRKLSKPWLAIKMGHLLEPWAVRRASLITGISEGYYSPTLDRNPHLRENAIHAPMPYGNSENDFELARRTGNRPYIFDPSDGSYHFIYAGALLPRARPVLERLFQALAHLKNERPVVFSRLRMHFVGTGRSPDDTHGYQILPYAERYCVTEIINEIPQRIPYTDVLSHLLHSSAILIVGSTESHYSPSKIYQSVQAHRPIFAILHKSSTGVRVLRESNAGFVVQISENDLPQPSQLAASLANFVSGYHYDPDKVNWSRFSNYSARESARRLGAAMDAALLRFSERARK
jgi:hypothetical protein